MSIHLLFTCFAYGAILATYDDILRGDEYLSVTLKRTPRRLNICDHVCVLHSHIETFCFEV